MRRLSVSLGAIAGPCLSVMFIKFPLPICLSCHLAFSAPLHYNKQIIIWRILFSTSVGFPGWNRQLHTQEDLHADRKYKDRLFRLVFSDKKDLLDLYNAVNGTDYQNPEELEVNTLENVLYLSMKNDLSFLIDAELNLYEHQSTCNPNMPMRGFLYFGDLYSAYIALREINLYSSTAKQFPIPLNNRLLISVPAWNVRPWC